MKNEEERKVKNNLNMQKKVIKYLFYKLSVKGWILNINCNNSKVIHSIKV